MKYGFLPGGMWLVFHRSFEKQLLLMTNDDPGVLMRKAHETYGEILADIPDFDRDDRFLMNILSAAMLAAVYLNLREKPALDAVTTIKTAIPRILIPAGFCTCSKNLVFGKSRPLCAAMIMTWRSWAAPSLCGSIRWRTAVSAVTVTIRNEEKNKCWIKKQLMLF